MCGGCRGPGFPPCPKSLCPLAEVTVWLRSHTVTADRDSVSRSGCGGPRFCPPCPKSPRRSPHGPAGPLRPDPQPQARRRALQQARRPSELTLMALIRFKLHFLNRTQSRRALQQARRPLEITLVVLICFKLHVLNRTQSRRARQQARRPPLRRAVRRRRRRRRRLPLSLRARQAR